MTPVPDANINAPEVTLVPAAPCSGNDSAATMANGDRTLEIRFTSSLLFSRGRPHCKRGTLNRASPPDEATPRVRLSLDVLVDDVRASAHRAFVNQLLGGANAVGRRLHDVEAGRREAARSGTTTQYEIVGVVTDLGTNSIEPDLIEPVIYHLAAELDWGDGADSDARQRSVAVLI